MEDFELEEVAREAEMSTLLTTQEIIDAISYVNQGDDDGSTVSQGVSGLFGLLIVVPGTQLYYVIAMLAAYAAGFALTYFFGVDESRINDVFGE